jgi:hypothetical protein
VAQTLESLQRIHGFILQLPNEVDQKVHNWHAGVLWAHSIAKAIGKNVSGTHHHGIAATELRELPQAHPLLYSFISCLHTPRSSNYTM